MQKRLPRYVVNCLQAPGYDELKEFKDFKEKIVQAELGIVMGLSRTVTIMTVQSYVKVFIVSVIQLTIYVAIYVLYTQLWTGCDQRTGGCNNNLNLLLHNISYIIFIVSMVVI